MAHHARMTKRRPRRTAKMVDVVWPSTPGGIREPDMREANFEARREAKALAAAGIDPQDRTPHPTYPWLFVSTPQWVIDGVAEQQRPAPGMIRSSRQTSKQSR